MLLHCSDKADKVWWVFCFNNLLRMLIRIINMNIFLTFANNKLSFYIIYYRNKSLCKMHLLFKLQWISSLVVFLICSFASFVLALPKPDPTEFFSSHAAPYAYSSYYSHVPIVSNFYTAYRSYSNYYY